MKRRIEGLAALSLLCIASACKTQEAEPVAAPPVIESFTVDRTEILPGESAQLRYTVTHAEEVKLLSVEGEELAVEGDASYGTASVSPEESAIYVLRARGAGGRAASFVQVTVGEPLASVFLMAVPPEIDPGAPAELVWSAQGATAVELRNDLGDIFPITGTSGVVLLSPEQSAEYTLTATGPDGAKKIATARVTVRPRFELLSAEPGLVNAGDALRFAWQAPGADGLVITEKTFGEVYRAASASEAREGFSAWTIPTTLPGTESPLIAGFRLEFTVTATVNGATAVATRTIVRHLGQGPAVHTFIAPVMATQGKDIPLSWEVSGAERIQIFANGRLVSEPRADEMSLLFKSSLLVPAPVITTRYDLVVHGSGATASSSRMVEVALPAQATAFHLTPSISQAGDAAMASWETLNATQVQIRIKNGPVVYASTDPSTVARGTASIRPARTTTYVLEALNKAGDLVQYEESRTVDVSVPVEVAITPSHPLPGQVVTVSWNLPEGDAIEVIGAPDDPTDLPKRRPMSGSFVDLTNPATRGTSLEFGNTDDSVAELPATVGFSFPMLGTVRSRYFVSTNGFVGLEPTGSMPENVTALPATERLPALLAPFWDDLDLGDGEVLYRVDRDQVPARLTIQWEDVRLKSDATSRLSFQVQLFETGEARFVYDTLEPGDSQTGTSGATIGVNHDQRYGVLFAANGHQAVASGDELVWFTRELPDGSFSLPMLSSTRYSLSYRRANGELVSLSVPVTVWGQDTLAVREAMPQPLHATKGQWVELVNTSHDTISLAGLQLGTNAGAWALPEWVSMEPGQSIVVGQSVAPNENGGAPVDHLLPELVLAAENEQVRIESQTVPISTLSWADSTSGESIEREQRVRNAAGVEKVCPRTATFGPSGAKGTPGAPREACWDYLLEPIAYNPTDILNSGEVLFYNSSGNDQVVLPLREHPFRLFDTVYKDVLLARNGFLSFVYSPTDSNLTTANPVATTPNGALAIFGQSFWMNDAHVRARPPYVLYRRVAPNEVEPGSVGHYVVQWHRGTSLSDKDVDVSFQIKFFDDGVIEYHYGLMQNGTKSIAYGQGESASSWLENETGTEALVINAKSRTPGIQSHTAFRFSPL